MTDPSEIGALKASFRGAITTADALGALREKIESLGGNEDLSASDLEEVARVTAAHSIASAALRGLVETMIARRRAGAA